MPKFLFYRPKPATLLIKRFWCSCFPVNFVKFLRIPFFIEHLWWRKYLTRKYLTALACKLFSQKHSIPLCYLRSYVYCGHNLFRVRCVTSLYVSSALLSYVKNALLDWKSSAANHELIFPHSQVHYYAKLLERSSN